MNPLASYRAMSADEEFATLLTKVNTPHAQSILPFMLLANFLPRGCRDARSPMNKTNGEDHTSQINRFIHNLLTFVMLVKLAI